MKSRNYVCPACGSPATKRCRILYEQSVNEGPNFDTRRRFGQRASPPTIQSRIYAVICLLVGGVSVYASPSFGLFMLVLGVGLMIRRAILMPRYKESMDLYEKLWICTDCGHVYQPRNVAR